MKKNQTQAKTNNTSGSVWFLILGVSFVTLYFNTKAYDPFNTPKLIFLLITAGWLTGHIVNEIRNGSINFRSVDVLIIVLPTFFVLAQIVSLFYTDTFIVGLIGDTQRRNGLLGYIALMIIFLFSSLRIDINYAIRIIKFAILLALVLCVYGLLQTSGKDFVSWNNPYNSMIATLGNPNFASSIIALMILISLFSIAINNINIFYKMSSVVVIVIGTFLIIRSQSRQGLLVVLFSILFYISILSYFNFKKVRILIIASTILISVFSVLGMLRIGPFSEFLYKGSVSVRGYYWRAAVMMFEKYPITGVGLDSYGSYFKEFRESSYSLNYGFEITSTNAHNVYLQLFSTGGFFVGASYLLILFYILVVGIKNLKARNKENKKVALLLLSTWVGFQSQSLISIDNIGISIWGWLLGGCIVGIYKNSEAQSKTDVVIKKYKNEINLFQPIVSSLILLPIFFISIYLHRMETDTYLAKAFDNPSNSQNSSQVNYYAQKVINNPMSDPFYKMIVSLYMVDMGDLESGYREILNLHKKDLRNLDYLRWLVEYERNKQNTKNEIDYRIQITKLDPWNADNYFNLGMLYKKIGDNSNALIMKNKILSFAQGTEISNKAISGLS